MKYTIAFIFHNFFKYKDNLTTFSGPSSLETMISVISINASTFSRIMDFLDENLGMTEIMEQYNHHKQGKKLHIKKI